MKSLCLLLIPFISFAQSGIDPSVIYINSQTATQSLTIQGSTNSPKGKLISAYVQCAANCTISLRLHSEAVTATRVNSIQINPNVTPLPSRMNVFNDSDASGGSIINTIAITGGTDKVIDLGYIVLKQSPTSNLTIESTSNATITLLWAEL